ncbi:MAG: hypothetical protein ACXACF_09280, partial [Candidatus Hermodarchaeia archaeon]|jgi:hypothetical protein
VLVQILFLLVDGGLDIELLLPIIIFNGLTIPFGLGLIHVLDNRAETALTSMRPMLDVTDSEFERYKFELSNMRSLPMLVAGLAIVLLLIVTDLLGFVPIRYAAMEQMPVFAAVYHIFDKVTAFVMGVFFYHTVVQLRQVKSINSNCIHVNLFNQRPLQSFSRLTGLTALGLVFGAYGWSLINPDLLTNPISIFSFVIMTMLAFSVFVFPIYSVHRLLKNAKERELQDIDLRFEAVFSKFNKCLTDDDDSAVEKLSGRIASLEIQRRRVEEIRTWPWRAESGRIALTMIALPLIMTILRFLIDLAIGW